MSVETFVAAMPKVELHVHLEGAMRKKTLLMIAEQNEISYHEKDFEAWVAALDDPDPERLDELARVTSRWIQQPEDLSRIVYDLGVQLSRQQIRYAEVSVNPALYMQSGMTYEQVLAALNDGRDRAQRAWNVDMVWILSIPRNEPRRSDEYARWATNAGAEKNNIVGLGLHGREDIQPVGQFERAFRVAQKKKLSRLAHAPVGDQDEWLEMLQMLQPDRVVDGWGLLDVPEAVTLMVENDIALEVSLTRAQMMGLVESVAEYPLRGLYDEDLKLTIGSDMPVYYGTTLNDEYRAVIEQCDFTVDELEELALNAVRYSLLSPANKEAMLVAFADEYRQLRGEHLDPSVEE